MVKSKHSNQHTLDNTKDNRIIGLGEFWVDSDGEVFIDPDDPLTGLKNAQKLAQIKQLQKRLKGTYMSHKATRYSNRRPSD